MFNQRTSRGNCGGHSDTGTNVSPKHFGVPINVFPPVFHTKSGVYHQRYMMLATDSVV